MSSLLTAPTGTSGSRLAALVASSQQVHQQIADLLADPSLAAEIATVPADAVAGFVTALLSSIDTATAATTVLVGHVDAGTGPGTGLLVDGKYASTRRFLEVEGGMSQKSASAMVARARDLRGDYAVLAEPWLTGAVTSDAVRVITTGVRSAIRASGMPYADRVGAREASVALVMPVARVGTVEDVRRAIRHLQLVTDPDGATQAAMDAFDDQSLTVEQVGAMVKLTAWLTPDASAAMLTVLTAQVDTWRREGGLAPEEQLPDGVDPESWEGRRRARERYDHLLALALGETFTSLLDNNDIGSHHGIAPHVTLTVDVARFEAGLGGDLMMPGSDLPVLVPNATVERICCDADLTIVLTRPLASADPDSCLRPLGDLLLEASREVLYVGRAERVVPPRLRRALEARDRHCAFPGCRASVRRCHAHHVRQWEHGGRTDLDNMLLLCVRHHHAVHEGGWLITRAAGIPPGGTGCWEFTAPARPRRP